MAGLKAISWDTALTQAPRSHPILLGTSHSATDETVPKPQEAGPDCIHRATEALGVDPYEVTAFLSQCPLLGSARTPFMRCANARTWWSAASGEDFPGDHRTPDLVLSCTS